MTATLMTLSLLGICFFFTVLVNDLIDHHRQPDGRHPETAPRRTDGQRRPESLGKLVVVCEQNVFMRGRIWGISSFDQWGVQLGKHLAQRIVHELEATSEPDLRHDSATKALIRRYGQHGDDGAPHAAAGSRR